MSWFQENKFLGGLIAVTVVGVGALGYLTYDAMAKYSAAAQELENATQEKKRLESLPVYPNAKNVEKLNQDREEHRARILDLQKRLSAMTVPEESISPQGFQDRLRTSVTNYTKKAAEAGMKFSEGQKFYMGFDVYQTKTPEDTVAPKLLRQLKAIEQVVNLLPEHRVDEFTRISRNPLVEEGGRRPAATPAPKGGAKKTDLPPPSVNKQTFELGFRCEPGALQNVLNGIATQKSQFYIVRNVRIENDRLNPPSREEILQKSGAPGADAGAAPAPEAPAAPAPAPAPAPAAAPTEAGAAPAAPPETPPTETANSGVISFIVGEERVKVAMLVEIVDFTPPAQPETKGKKK